jgi:hypothetical protein
MHSLLNDCNNPYMVILSWSFCRTTSSIVNSVFNYSLLQGFLTHNTQYHIYWIQYSHLSTNCCALVAMFYSKTEYFEIYSRSKLITAIIERCIQLITKFFEIFISGKYSDEISPNFKLICREIYKEKNKCK